MNLNKTFIILTSLILISCAGIDKKSSSSKDLSNRGMFMNYDIFMNVSVYRKGNYKLILGSPGPPVVFEEPTSSILNNVKSDHFWSFLFMLNAQFPERSLKINF